MPDNFIIRNMPEGLRQALKLAAVKRNVSMNQLIIDIIHDWLKRQKD